MITMEEENKVITPIEENSKQLENKTLEVTSAILEEEDQDKLKDLTYLFNLNMIKKNTLRILKYNELLDYIYNSMVDRFQKRPDEMSNKDLIDYLNAISGSLDKISKNNESLENKPTIVFNQQNNNLNIQPEDTINRESKEKILDFINNYIKNLNNEDSTSENEINDIDEEEVEEGDQNA